MTTFLRRRIDGDNTFLVNTFLAAEGRGLLFFDKRVTSPRRAVGSHLQCVKFSERVLGALWLVTYVF